MLSEKGMKLAQTKWEALVVFRPNKDGYLRFCVYVWNRDAAKKQEVHPIPLMAECIEMVGGATAVSTLDVISKYWEVENLNEDQDRTALTSYLELYSFEHLVVGLRNAPSTFGRKMDVALSAVGRKFEMVYIDDIVLISRSAAEHIAHAITVITHLSNTKVTVNLKRVRSSRKPLTTWSKLFNHGA